MIEVVYGYRILITTMMVYSLIKHMTIKVNDYILHTSNLMDNMFQF
jgi:hypothetical protein